MCAGCFSQTIQPHLLVDSQHGWRPPVLPGIRFDLCCWPFRVSVLGSSLCLCCIQTDEPHPADVIVHRMLASFYTFAVTPFSVVFEWELVVASNLTPSCVIPGFILYPALWSIRHCIRMRVLVYCIGCLFSYFCAFVVCGTVLLFFTDYIGGNAPNEAQMHSATHFLVYPSKR